MPRDAIAETLLSAEDRQQPAAAFLRHLLERIAEGGELGAPADERRVVPARVAGGALDHREQRERLDRIALPLRGQRLVRLENRCVRDQTPRRSADEHLARAGGLLQPLRSVHRVARDERLAARRVTGDDLAGVDPDAHVQLDAQPAREVLVQLRKRRAHVDRGAYRTQRVVFVQLRHAEDGHHRVADELLHRSAVPLQHAAHLVEPACHHAAEGFRIELLPETRRVGDVAEDDRHGLARRGHRAGGGGERRAAGRAVASRRLVLLAASGTCGHGQSVGVGLERAGGTSRFPQIPSTGPRASRTDDRSAMPRTLSGWPCSTRFRTSSRAPSVTCAVAACWTRRRSRARCARSVSRCSRRTSTSRWSGTSSRTCASVPSARTF